MTVRSSYLKLLLLYRFTADNKNILEPGQSPLAPEGLLLLPVSKESPPTRVQVVVSESASTSDCEIMPIRAEARVLYKAKGALVSQLWTDIQDRGSFITWN